MIAFVCWLACFCVLARAWVNRKQLARRQQIVRAAAGVALAVVAVVAGPGGLVLQKLVARLLMPAAWVWDLAWVAFVVGIARARRRLALAGAVTGVLLTLAGSEAIGGALNEWLERDFRDDPYTKGAFDAVFLLGGGVDVAPHPGYELGPSGDRVALAARLHHRGLASHIVISGTVIEGLAETFDNVSATDQILRELGVPDEAIVRQPGATRNTREEAEAAARLVHERGWTHVGLVTSAWHMRRALGLFERAGVNAVPLAADHRGSLQWDGLYSIVPRDAGYYLVSKATWEVLGAAAGF